MDRYRTDVARRTGPASHADDWTQNYTWPDLESARRTAAAIVRNNPDRAARVFDRKLGVVVETYYSKWVPDAFRDMPARLRGMLGVSNPPRSVRYKTHKGVYYFLTPAEAVRWGWGHGWPTTEPEGRIVEYQRGYAIQAGPSGNYAGPGETPRPWKGTHPR